MTTVRLGTGIGWRPEIADAVEAMPGVDWVEAVAENVCPGHLPASLLRLRERGVTVVPHGVSLGLGDAGRPDERRLTALAERATALRSPLVTEHIAFVRAGGPLTASPGIEAGHLLPVPRTRDALDVLCENVRIAQDALPVPLAVENIAALFSWPGEEMTEGQFLYELADRTGVRLLIDVANLHTNRVNRGEDPAKALAELPWRPSRTSMSRAASNGTASGTTATPTRCRRRCWTSSPTSPPACRPRAYCWSGTSTSRPRRSWSANWPRSAGRWRRGRGSAGLLRRSGCGSPAVGPVTGATRERLALAQTAVLSALVAGTPVPEGFDRTRMRVQARALAAKRADVVAKVAPELPEILGDGYRPAFLAYARTRPMTGGYRQDALAFVDQLLRSGTLDDPRTRRELRAWWLDRSGPRPRAHRPATRLARATRRALLRR